MDQLPSPPVSDTSSNTPAARCENCGTVLQGHWCHVCGQSDHGTLRHLPEMIGDATEMLLQLDGRLMRTLPTLYLFPGRLTREYLSGHRVRYVTPFRLMFVLCLLAFFFMQLSLHLGDNSEYASGAFAQATTAKAVLDKLDTQRAKLKADGGNHVRIEVLGHKTEFVPAQALDLAALKRMRQLQDGKPLPATLIPRVASVAQRDLGDARSSEEVQQVLTLGLTLLDGHNHSPPPAAASSQQTLIRAAGDRLAQLRPVAESTTTAAGPDWLPAPIRRYLAGMARHLHENMSLMRHGNQSDRLRIVGHILSVLPQSMLVLIPVFALLLQIMYLFRRRLYMEHLIVALNSHAFMFLSLLLLIGLDALRSVLPAWAGSPIGGLRAAAFLWIPVYLLLMQKRVYGQGWTMTVFKYLITGFIYLLMMATTVGIAALIGMAN